MTTGIAEMFSTTNRPGMIIHDLKNKRWTKEM